MGGVAGKLVVCNDSNDRGILPGHNWVLAYLPGPKPARYLSAKFPFSASSAFSIGLPTPSRTPQDLTTL